MHAPRSKPGGNKPGNGARTGTDVLPHNLQAERSLLGIALLSSAARDAAAAVPIDAYYSPAHQTIAAAILELHLDGHPVDPVTVADKIGAEQLDKIGGGALLVELQNQTPGGASSAPAYVQIILEDWQLRRTLYAALELGNAARAGQVDDVAHWRAELADVGSTITDSSWDEVDLGPVVNGEQLTRPPTMLHRDDGLALIYPGEIHAFNAESESGKTWLALAAVVEELNTGSHVIYVDNEDSAEGITERLASLGAHLGLLYGPDRLFHYVRPDDPIDTAAITRLARIGASLVVIDGVTEAMSMNGFSIKENDDVALFLKLLPRVFARAGAAVILIDHVVKNKQERGNDAIGGQHKRAGIAASYKLEMLRPFGRNMGGSARIITTKDRFGHVRAGCAGGRTAGELRLVSSGSQVTLTIAAPSSIVDPDATFRPTVLMERISRAIEEANAGGIHPSGNDILKIAAGKKTAKLTALKALVTEGFVEARPGRGGAHHHVSIKPYREIDDPSTPLYDNTQRDEDEEVETF